MPSVSELKLFSKRKTEMLKEALQFEPTEITAKFEIDETLFQPTDVEEKAKSDVFWEVSETARRKVCVTRTIFQDDPNRCYFKIKLFNRGTNNDSITRKWFLLVRIGSCRNYIQWAMELFQCWTNSKTKKIAKCIEGIVIFYIVCNVVYLNFFTFRNKIFQNSCLIWILRKLKSSKRKSVNFLLEIQKRKVFFCLSKFFEELNKIKKEVPFLVV